MRKITKYNKNNYKKKVTFFVKLNDEHATSEDLNFVQKKDMLEDLASDVCDALRKSGCFVKSTLRDGFTSARIDVSIPYWLPDDEAEKLHQATVQLTKDLHGDYISQVSPKEETDG